MLLRSLFGGGKLSGVSGVKRAEYELLQFCIAHFHRSERRQGLKLDASLCGSGGERRSVGNETSGALCRH
jgi:hypothetical protein